MMSWRYYAKSVLDPLAYPALKCESYTNYQDNLCDGNQMAYMGYSTPRKYVKLGARRK